MLPRSGLLEPKTKSYVRDSIDEVLLRFARTVNVRAASLSLASTGLRVLAAKSDALPSVAIGPNGGPRGAWVSRRNSWYRDWATDIGRRCDAPMTAYPNDRSDRSVD
jgi:hypothetical protein